MRKQMLALMAAAIGIGASAGEALWMRDVKISPDGTRIAFTYKGDIYTVGVKGGEARRLTTLEPDMEPRRKPYSFCLRPSWELRCVCDGCQRRKRHTSYYKFSR